MTDKVVYLVTGANRGIGFGLVKSLADRPNAIVFAGVRDVSKADDLRKVGDNIHPITTNAGDAEDNKAAVETMRKIAGGVDVVIANAGISTDHSRVLDVPISAVVDHHAVNTLGPLVLFQAVYPLLSESKRPKFIVISSQGGSISDQSKLQFPIAAYGSSKAALNYLVRKIHFEHEDMICFPLNPGWVATDMASDNKNDMSALGDGPMPVEKSVEGLLHQIDISSRATHGGCFMSFDGEKFLW